MEAAAVDERPPEARFTIGENIGQGAFGMVYRGVEIDTGVPPPAQPPDPVGPLCQAMCMCAWWQREVAIKILDLEETADDIDDIKQEISVMAQCRSPYVRRDLAPPGRPETRARR